MSGLDGGIVVAGSVHCLVVVGNTAFLGGVVTKSSFFPNLVGQTWAGVAVDNGHAGDPPDIVGDTVGDPAFFSPTTMCELPEIQSFLLEQQVTLLGDMKVRG